MSENLEKIGHDYKGSRKKSSSTNGQGGGGEKAGPQALKTKALGVGKRNFFCGFPSAKKDMRLKEMIICE